MVKNILIGVGLYFVLPRLMNGISNKVSYEFQRPKLTDVHLLKQTMDIRLAVKNNLDIPIVIDSILGDLIREGKTIGQVEVLQGLSVDAAATKMLVIEVKILTEDFFNSFF